MAQDLGPEIPDVQAEDLALAHRAIAPRGRPDPALAGDVDRPERRQPAPEIRVLAVKLDRAIEPADAVERIPPHREVAAVEDGAGADEVVHEHVRRRRDDAS